MSVGPVELFGRFKPNTIRRSGPAKLRHYVPAWRPENHPTPGQTKRTVPEDRPYTQKLEPRLLGLLAFALLLAARAVGAHLLELLVLLRGEDGLELGVLLLQDRTSLL